MKLLLSIFFSISLQSFLFGQIDSVSIIYSNEISEAQLRYKIDVLADDTLLGRETAKEGQKKAEKFIISEFQKYGLAPGNNGSYLQFFNLYKLGLNTVDFTFNKHHFDSISQLFNLNWSKSGTITGEDLIFCGFGINSESYNDYIGLDVSNKLVFVLDGTPKDESGKSILSSDEDSEWNRNRANKENLAKDLGAKGIVFIKESFSVYKKTVERNLSHSRSALYDESIEHPDFASIYMDEDLAYSLFDIHKEDIDDYIKKGMKGKKQDKIEAKGAFSFTINTDIKKNETSNVLAKIEAEDPLAPWVILSAHYDHIGFDSSGVYNGADDNASGTAAVLELSRVFKKAYDEGYRPNKNILFILVSGEEKGLLGSQFYTNNPIYAIENTMVNLNIDMIGRLDKVHEGNSNYIYIIGADRISQKLHDINSEANALYTGLFLDYTYNDPADPNKYYQRSDHYNFAKKGVPVIFYFNGTHEDYHRIGDTKDKIDYEAYLVRTRLIFHTAWELSNMKGDLLN